MTSSEGLEQTWIGPSGAVNSRTYIGGAIMTIANQDNAREAERMAGVAAKAAKEAARAAMVAWKKAEEAWGAAERAAQAEEAWEAAERAAQVAWEEGQ